ncbi:MAG: ExbD/TolR family protein [Myxococcaceae bacterium]
MAFQMNPSSAGRYQPMSEINVTPFVDVMLVLLIIFMVTAPMMTSGLDLQLPEAAAAQLSSTENKLTLSLSADRRMMLGDKELRLDQLPASLKNAKEIQLHADKNLPYGFVVKIMAVLKSNGVDNISLVTDSSGEKVD